MEALPLVISLVEVFAVAFVGAWVAKKLNQPIITGYLVAGLLATIFLGRFFQFSHAQVLADMGLAFLMFVIGLEFSYNRLAKVKKIAIFGACLQMILTTLILFPLTGNFIMALVFSLSSTAIVVKIISERGELDTLPAEIIIGWLLVQDLAVVPILAVLDSQHIFFSLAKAAVLLYVILVLGKRFAPKFLTKIAQIGSNEVLLIALVGVVLFSAALTNYFGLSFALGAFLAGLLVSESASQHAVFSEIRPLRDVFAVIFFVTLGVLVSPAYLLANWGLILKLVVLVVLVKFVVVTAITLVFKYHLKTALQVGLSLTQVGEFAFVVARLALASSLITQDIYSLILAVTILTMVVTPWQIKASVGIFEKLKYFTGKWSPRLYAAIFSSFDRYKKEHPELEMTKHVVICGHGRVGKHITRILAMAEVPFVVVDYNQNVISELSISGVPTVFGDPTDRDVLKFAGTKNARAVIIAVPDRYSQELIIQNAFRIKPGIEIICRSHFEEDHRRLYALGVSAVVSPELEAGLSMGHRLLDTLGFDKIKTATFLKQVRKENA